MTRSARVYQVVCVLAALAALLLVAAPMQRQLAEARNEAMPAQTFAETQDLDSFSMGLLLGGFRGPLVMYLWVASEEDKSNEDTEHFLTQAKLIGDLEPQFATIYTYQSWNLAYNVSVQYNRESEKYRWVMEGVRFAEKGSQRLPYNTDILSQLASLYEDKLGESNEGPYYRAQFRKDSLTPTINDDRPTLRVDENFRLLGKDPKQRRPDYAKQWPFIDHLDGLLAVINRNNQRGDKSPVPPATNDPNEYQNNLLKEYRDLGLDDSASRHTWKHGVSVFAIAYDYRKQATLTGRHAQFSPSVVSGQPPLACRAWLKDELGLAMEAESRLWPMDQIGRPLPVPAADTLPSNHAALLQDALDYYQEAQRVAVLTRAEYRTHLAVYPHDWDIYTTHLNDVAIKSQMADAGARRLAGIGDWLAAKAALRAALNTADPAARTAGAALMDSARQKLHDARTAYLEAIPLIRDYIASEYRYDPSSKSEDPSRAPFLKLADQAQRAADQIDAMLR